MKKDQLFESRRNELIEVLNSVEGPSVFLSIAAHEVYVALQTKKEKNVGYTDQYPTRLTNSVHHHEYGSGTIHNIGVSHTASFWKREEEYIQNAILDADVILLESGKSKYPDVDKPFFVPCRDYALAQGKQVRSIDTLQHIPYASAHEGCIFTLLIGGTLLGVDTIMNTIKDPSNRKYCSVRRNLLRLLTYGAVVPSYFLRANGSIDDFEKHDSYYQRGRSAQMTAKGILPAVKQHPNERILSISGESHACDIEVYLSDRDIMQRDIDRHALMEHLFGEEPIEVHQ